MNIFIFTSIQNNGDGSASNKWFLTYQDAANDQDTLSEPWGESCIEEVETIEGSVIHNEAIENSRQLNQLYQQTEEDERT